MNDDIQEYPLAWPFGRPRSQYISDDGRKMYYPGGRKDRSSVILGYGDPNLYPLLITEGYATAASLRELSKSPALSVTVVLPVVAAFDTGNLSHVARAYREKYPERMIVIAADNDHSRERELDAQGNPKANVGKLAAIAAADAVGGIVVLPGFTPDEPGTDWNDVAQTKGIDEARVHFRRALQLAERVRGARSL